MTHTPDSETDAAANLKDKTILVTGASGGIGRAIAVLAAARGARLALQGRDVDRLEQTKNMLAGSGHTVFVRDLGSVDGLDSWFEGIVAAVGPISGFVHSAGIVATAPLKIVTAEAANAMWQLNVLSALLLCKEMRKAKNHTPNAGIVFLSSVAGLRGNSGQIVYAATKAALVGATRSMAMELIRDKIRVNAVAPALVDTGMRESLSQNAGSNAFNETLRDHPMGTGSPEDVAQMVCFLLSDAAKWITGATYPVDGGYTAGRV